MLSGWVASVMNRMSRNSGISPFIMIEKDPALAGLLHQHAGRLERQRRIDQVALKSRHISGRFGAEIDALDVARQRQSVFFRQHAEHLLARAVG